MTTIIAIDTAEVAATPQHDIDLWFHVVEDTDRDRAIDGFRAMGFTPMIADPLCCSSCGSVGTYEPDLRWFAVCSACGHCVAAVDFEPDEGEQIRFALWPAVLCVIFVAD